MDIPNGSDNTDHINKRAVVVFVVIVLVVLALAVWGGTLLGKSRAATQNQELSANLTSAQQQLAQLQSTSAGLQKNEDALQAQLAAAQQNMATLQAQLAAAQQNMATLQAQLAAAQQNNATLQTQLAAAQQNNAALQTQLAAAQQNITALQAQLAAWYAWSRNAPPVPATAGPSIILSSTSGPMGTSITITGNGFAANTIGNVVFDINRNGTSDPGEPIQNVTTLSSGTFSTTLVVPSLPPGTYPVLAVFPIGAPAQASATFTVTTGAGS